MMNYQYNPLFEDNVSLVYGIVNKMDYGYIEKDDLIQAGLSGLLDATKKYKKGMNVKFSSYAFIYIINAIKKEMRENQLIVLSKEIIKIKKEISKNNNRTIKEISKQLNVSEENVIVALSYTNNIQRDDDLINKIPDQNDNGEIIKHALKKLETKLQQVIIFKYYKLYSQSKIAKIMNCSQAKVSRLEKIALSTMKKMIN